MKTSIRFLSHFAEFFLELEVFQTKVVDEIKHMFYVKYVFFLENRTV